MEALGNIWKHFSGWYYIHIISTLKYSTWTLQDIPPGEQIYSLSVAPARYARASSDIILRMLGVAAEFLELFIKGCFIASGPNGFSAINLVYDHPIIHIPFP